MSKEKAKTLTYEVESPEAKLSEINKDVKTLDKRKQKTVTIKNEDDYQLATNFVVEVKGRIKRIKELKTDYVKPLKEGIKRLEGLFNEPLRHYEGIETEVKSAMAEYQREMNRKLKEKEEKEKAKREAQAKKGKIDPTPVPTYERPEKTARTEEGGRSTAKKVWKFEVEDTEKLLKVKGVKDELVALAIEKGLLDRVVRQKVLSGVRELNGVRIYEDYDINVSV